MISFALTSSKLTLDIAAKLVKANVRLHNAEAIADDMATVFVVNHFTRLETLLLPYILLKHTGKTVWSLAAAELFRGRIGEFLRSTGTVSTRDPDRDKVIIRSLLQGEHPWLIFPEGAMIKDKEVVNPGGVFQVYADGKGRLPRRGAAVLALITEFYRHKMACLKGKPSAAGLDAVLERFGLESFDQALSKRTVIVPVKVTYLPIRAHDNIFLRAARAMAHDPGPRALEDLSVEGTVLSEDTDIDVVLGNPIDVRAYVQEPQYGELVACGVHDMDAFEKDPKSLFNDAARRLILRYMEDIYYLTTVNCDHLLAALLRCQRPGRFSERSLRHRLFLCGRELQSLNYDPLHCALVSTCEQILYGEPCGPFEDFVALAVREGVLRTENGQLCKAPVPRETGHDFHSVRRHAVSYAIADEVDPLPVVRGVVQRIARLRTRTAAQRVRETLLREDQQVFEQDYTVYYDEELSKGPDVGRPYLLRPWRFKKAGVLLTHGYMAAPLEVRALAEFLRQKGYAVYGVRLKGHGTSPEDLGQTHWEEWYESLNRGYALIRSLTDKVILGGFSMGAGLTLLAAGRKGPEVCAAFAIDAPLHLRNHLVRLVPSLVRVNALLRKFHWERTEWEYVANEPENPHINYTRNPLYGVEQLGHVMSATQDVLGQICAPTLIIQGSRDPVVAPESGQDLFAKIGTPHKQLLVLERERHGIVNGEGAEDVFAAIDRFLRWALTKQPLVRRPENAAPAAS